MKKNWVSVALIVAAVVLSVISWILLPDVVAVQIGMDGQASNTMPKAFAVVIPLGISVAGSVMNLKSDGENTKKGFLLSLTGIVVMVLCLLFNR